MTKEQFFIIMYLHWVDEYFDYDYPTGIIHSFATSDIVEFAEECGVNEIVVNAIKRHNNILVRLNKKLTHEETSILLKERDNIYDTLKRIGKNFYRKRRGHIRYIKSID